MATTVKATEEGLEVQVNAIGDYLVTSEDGGWYEFRADLPSIGVYNTEVRKEYNRDYIDNLEKNIKVYEGRDCSNTTFKAIEGFVNVEKNPVTYEDNGVAYGYPIQLTNAIDRNFSIIMSAERIGSTLYKLEKCSGKHYDEFFVDYIPINKLQVRTAPTKVEYTEGTAFDPSGLVVEAVYDDEESFTLSKDEYKLAVSDKLSTNDKAVTISYLGTLPAKTTTIKAGVFNGCKKLKTITIKSTKLTSKTIAKGAFKGLGKGTTIKVPKKKFAEYKKLFKQKGLSSKVKLTKA